MASKRTVLHLNLGCLLEPWRKDSRPTLSVNLDDDQGSRDIHNPAHCVAYKYSISMDHNLMDQEVHARLETERCSSEKNEMDDVLHCI